MLSTPSGRRLLRERPRITEASIDLDKLATMPEGSLGKAYVQWLKRNKVTPDTRDPVRPLFSPPFVQCFDN
jgi:ubiquinone biosynthesis protein COQ4